jgi:anterior pharynx defective protein 1
MTASLFVGSIFLCFGLVISVFFGLVFHRAQFLILSIVSALFWLLSLLCSSIFWYIIPDLRDSNWGLLPVSVFFTEIARYSLLVFYDKTVRSFSIVSINAIVFPLRDFYAAISSGLGFATARLFLHYGIILSHSLGEATLYAANCQRINSFIHAAINGMLFSFLDFALMIIAFDAYRQSQPLYYYPLWLSHLACALIQMTNQLNDGCAYSIVFTSLIVALTVGWAFVRVRSKAYDVKKRE